MDRNIISIINVHDTYTTDVTYTGRHGNAQIPKHNDRSRHRDRGVFRYSLNFTHYGLLAAIINFSLVYFRTFAWRYLPVDYTLPCYNLKNTYASYYHYYWYFRKSIFFIKKLLLSAFRARTLYRSMIRFWFWFSRLCICHRVIIMLVSDFDLNLFN